MNLRRLSVFFLSVTFRTLVFFSEARIVQPRWEYEAVEVEDAKWPWKFTFQTYKTNRPTE
jgi:hypothetical protein